TFRETFREEAGWTTRGRPLQVGVRVHPGSGRCRAGPTRQGLSRLTEGEMKKLMIDTSAGCSRVAGNAGPGRAPPLMSSEDGVEHRHVRDTWRQRARTRRHGR